MGRKSLLTDQQWNEIGLRLRNGETKRALALQFGVSVTTISQHVRARNGMPATARNAVKSTACAPVGGVKSKRQRDRKIENRTLAERLSSISDHLCAAAEQSAATARCLSEVARKQADEIDDAELLDGKTMGVLKAVALLTKMANDASEIGVNLLRANKDVPTASQPPSPVAIHFGVKDAYQDANDQT